jgi:hypothetical protein
MTHELAGAGWAWRCFLNGCARKLAAVSFERKWIGPERMTYGQGLNSDSTLCSDNRRAKANTKCIDCGCLINRGLRCGPCRDIADERRRQDAYAAKKAARDKL